MGKPVILVPQPVAVDEQPKFEGELREILRRADKELRREHGGVAASWTPTPTNLTELVGCVAGTSTEQVERVVLQLQGLSDLLRSERERVNREIAAYIKFNDQTTRCRLSALPLRN